MQIRKLLSTTLVCLSTLPSIADACGPWIPESFVTRNDDVFYAPPRVGFTAELLYILPDSAPYSAILDKQQEARNAEIDLIDALKAQSLDSDIALEKYRKCRSTLAKAKHFLDIQPCSCHRLEEDGKAMAALRAMTIPDSLPKEFQLYLRGARAYYLGEIETARKHWRLLLELPLDARKYRSTWATFMLAKTGKGESVPLEYQKVRDLVSKGFADSTGLAAASYGREALYYLDKARYAEAIDLYLTQWGAGYTNAITSLRTVAGRIFWQDASDETLQSLAQNQNSRAVLTAYLLTQSNTEQARRFRERWLNALPDPSELTLLEAGRFALMEYQLNHLKSSQQWIDYAAPDDALALWVKSKLLLRNGQITEGRTLLLALTAQMENANPDWRRLNTRQAWAELALLMLRKEDFVRAADCFANAGSWEDLAYVLERLLTSYELIEWVRNHKEEPENKDRITRGSGARSLAARRLMREGRFNAALKLFDNSIRSQAEDYIKTMQQASITTLEPMQRAQHYWTAAQITRDHGMELFGSEISPDFAWFDGQLDLRDIITERKAIQYAPGYQLNTPSWEEFERTETTHIYPEKRFHYRYRAAQLAEFAAGLLPNNDENAARIYCIAGSWLKKRDPDAADRLYKQLVIRCPDTELGQAASKLHWFPEVDLKTIEPFSQAI